MASTDVEHLKAIPYLDVTAIGSRTVTIMPLWENERWHVWIASPEGFFEMHPVAAVETNYVALSAASPSDILVPFVELMWQQASWPEICPLIRAISSDFQNFGTSIEKTSHFFAQRKALGHGCSHFVKTELEYMLMLSRSVFDLLQEVVARLWNKRIRLLDPGAEARRNSRKLPSTFSKMVLREKCDIRTSDELQTMHEIPQGMADAYITAAPFFAAVRDLRDAIVHNGKDLRSIYITERAFCISKSNPALERFDCWKPEHEENANITSLLPLLAHIVLGTVEVCNNLLLAFASQITLPSPIAPRHRVFIRGPHNDALLWMQGVSDGTYSPWWSERPTPEAA